MKKITSILSAILLSSMAMQSAYGQSKLNLHSKAMLKELQTEQRLNGNGTKSRANALEQTRIDAFIRIASQDVIPQLEALGVKVMANLKTIITCNLPIDKLNEISALDGVQSINFGDKPKLCNDRARHASHVDEVHTMVDKQGLNYTGKGVIYGTVDKGFDYNNLAFKNEDGSSRILYAYQPNDMSTFEGGEKYGNYPGHLFSGESLNKLTTDSQERHGTLTMSIGAGGRNGSDTYYGMAPEADIIACTYNSGIDVVNGIKLMIDKAKELGKPIAINLSAGEELGPHDGTSDLSAALDALAEPGVIISIACGNEGNDDTHLHKPAGKKIASVLYTKQFNEYGNYGRFTIEAWSRDNEHSFTAQLAVINIKTGEILNTSPVINADGRKDENMTEYKELTSFSKDASVMLGADYSPITGRREIVIKPKSLFYFDDMNLALALILDGDAEVEVYAKDVDFTNGSLPEPYVSGHTWGSFTDTSSGHNTISVGSYVTRTEWTNADGKEIKQNGTIGDFAESSSYGKSIDGRSFPTISAPGEYLITTLNKWANDYYDNTYIIKKDVPEHGLAVDSGTSMACPVVSGIIALWLQADPTLDVEGVRDIMSHTAMHDEFTDATPIRFGYGKIDAKAGLDYILKKQADGITNIYNDEKMPTKVLDRQKQRIVIRKDGHLYSVQGTKLQK